MINLHGEKIKKQAITNPDEMWLVVNFGLLILIGVLLAWYAFWSNFIAAGEYKENLLKLKLSETEKSGSELLSQKSDAASIGSLLVFSKTAGLMEQKNVEYIFSDKDVAQVH